MGTYKKMSKWVSEWVLYTSTSEQRKKKLYTDNKCTDFGEELRDGAATLTSAFQPVWLGRSSRHIKAWKGFYDVSVQIQIPCRSTKTSASIALYVNEIHNPPHTKMWQHTGINKMKSSQHQDSWKKKNQQYLLYTCREPLYITASACVLL